MNSDECPLRRGRRGPTNSASERWLVYRCGWVAGLDDQRVEAPVGTPLTRPNPGTHGTRRFLAARPIGPALDRGLPAVQPRPPNARLADATNVPFLWTRITSHGRVHGVPKRGTVYIGVRSVENQSLGGCPSSRFHSFAIDHTTRLRRLSRCRQPAGRLPACC